ncbi:PREDICTED: uncharacterized protein LOC107072128 isoform X2 [Polistes dominula]|uniref:Uncharacterized protein LOC107072128 isoform X2 n=1 Tax=Polistes dominula TaxID=743375 RepID=A0ABM1J4A5_POLDO|nr:PREDICTED: uncharacterized protein LOC107072128 isoform X2 [Polistes dominula]
MYGMQASYSCCILVWIIYCFSSVHSSLYVVLSHNGPVVLDGTITIKADLYKSDGSRPSGSFRYVWTDDALIPHRSLVANTVNTTTYWNLSYPRDKYSVGTYKVEVIVYVSSFFFWHNETSSRISFEVTSLLNGNLTVSQANKTTSEDFVSSSLETQFSINIREGDYNFIKENATSVSTYWFIDCKSYGQTNDLNFVYNFTNVDVSHGIAALVIASFEPIKTTTTTVTTTTVPSLNLTSNTSLINANASTALSTTTISPTTISHINATQATLMTNAPTINSIMPNHSNISFPYICLNTSIIPMDPNKTYGYFMKKILVRAPITNITIKGTDWIQPWDMLSLNVTCNGSGPFYKCFEFHQGKYNVTGNETCEYTDQLQSCNFSIVRYFFEPTEYTILVILNNDVSKQIYPKTITVYKVTPKPQLSVIVVPVSCTLVAVVLIVFGVAYYIQSRARFTVEVADFDFGQNNPEMEYKTFTERLRDSFNNAGYKPLKNSNALQT